MAELSALLIDFCFCFAFSHLRFDYVFDNNKLDGQCNYDFRWDLAIQISSVNKSKFTAEKMHNKYNFKRK